jgi:hypothetical protein
MMSSSGSLSTTPVGFAGYEGAAIKPILPIRLVKFVE